MAGQIKGAKTVLRFYAFVMSAMVYFLLQSCDDGSSSFTFGDDFLESNTVVTMIDTFGVELSSVLIDSIITSGNETMLIGNYDDTLIGSTSCVSYFEFTNPSKFNVDYYGEDVYDSLTLILTYNDYSFGDTLQDMNITVYQLLQNIELSDDDYLYNKASFPYSDEPLGSINFRPYPTSEDTVEIKLSDEFGMILFDMLTEKDNIFMESDAYFIDYFKGIALKSEGNNNLVLGFNGGDGEAVLRLYSHRVEAQIEEITHDFALTNDEKQFIEINTDYSSTNLNVFSSQREAILAEDLYNNAYVMAGTGLMTKVRFPSLNDFFLYENATLISAQLVLYPEKTHYTSESLPSTLYMYKTDEVNNFGSVVTGSSGSAITSTVYLDEFYREGTCYTFNITSLLKESFNNSWYDEKSGILLSLSSDLIPTTLEKVIFTTTKSPELILHYISY